MLERIELKGMWKEQRMYLRANLAVAHGCHLSRLGEKESVSLVAVLVTHLIWVVILGGTLDRW